MGTEAVKDDSMSQNGTGPAAFCARLRAQRERKQITLETIAEQTKIRASLMADLERGDMSHWPSGIFRRSYFRDYASAIGLDPEAALRDFAELFPDPTVEDPVVMAAQAAEADAFKPRTRLQYLLESAIGVLPLRGQTPRTTSIAPPPSSRAATSDTVSDAALALSEEGPSADLETAIPPAPAAAPSAVSETVTAAPPATTAIESPSAESNQTTSARRLDATPAAATSGDGDEAAVLAAEQAADSTSPSDEESLIELANVCGRLAQARMADDVAAALGDAATLLGAVGVILWTWSPQRSALRPSFCHGYPKAIVEQLPLVKPESDTAIGAAFRSVSLRIVDSAGAATGAVVVPVVTPAGCRGVLAAEVSGSERRESLHALMKILAAQFSAHLDAGPLERTAIA